MRYRRFNNYRKFNASFAVVLVMLLVFVLSVGFAAFNSVLTISSKAKVRPGMEDFNVIFTNVINSGAVGNVRASALDGVSGDDIVLDNSSNTSPFTNSFNVHLTKPGDIVQYVLYAYNNGQYDAYLNNINFIPMNNGKFIDCSTDDEVSIEDLERVCSSLSVSVEVGDSSFESSSVIDNHMLTIGNSETITITVKYNENSNSVMTGNFDISVGSIQFIYDMIDDSDNNDNNNDENGGNVEFIVGNTFSINSNEFHIISVNEDTVIGLANKNINTSTNQQSDDYSVVSYDKDNIQSYIDNYVNSLNINANGRLLKLSDTEPIGCFNSSCSSTLYSWIYSVPYWLEDVNNDLYSISNDGSINVNSGGQFGIRPVIEVAKSKIR